MRIVDQTKNRILAEDRGIWYSLHLGEPDTTSLFYGPQLDDHKFIDDPFTYIRFRESPQTFVPRFLADPLIVLMEHTL